MKSFENKVVVITGASRGIGKELAVLFLKSKAYVAICNRDLAQLQKTEVELLKHCENSGYLFCSSTDLSDLNSAKEFMNCVIKKFGKIDILVNNAALGLFQDLSDVSIADAKKLFEINFFAPLVLIQQTLPLMRKQKSGYIVNISSIISKHSVFYQGIYAASKSALDRLTESLRAEETKNGIITLSVWPDRTKTDFRQYVLGPKENAHLPQNLKENSPSEIAQRIYDSIKAERYELYTTLMSRIYSILSFFAPVVVRHVMRRK